MKIDYGERAGVIIKHHNLARSRHGKNTVDNLIRLDENREKAFHLIFKNRTFQEAAELLRRADRLKRRQA